MNIMDTASSTRDFSVQVEGTKASCPVGERYASEQMAQQRTPVLSCEGPCIRGEIARLAANTVAREMPGLARSCHAEAFFVPHSAMSRWVRSAPKVVMIDGCFLQCHGRVVRKLVPEQRVIHFDALSLHRKYSDVFLIEDVPEEERVAAARQVADAILEELRDAGTTGAAPDAAAAGAPRS
jgi:uncharacterized metal-binding protein